MLASIGRLLATHAVAMFMLSVGLRTSHQVVVTMLREQRGLVIRALVAVWLGVPLLALAILYALRPPPLSAATLMVMAICPGVPLLLRRTSRVHGDRDTALIVLLTTLATAIVLTPLWALVLDRITPLELHFRMRDVVVVILPTVVVPYVLGRIINVKWPRVAARLAPIANALFLIGLGLIVVMLVVKTGLGLREISLRGAIACIVIGFGAGAIGYFATSARVDQRTAIAYGASFGNPALALAVMSRSYPAKAAPLIVLFLVLRTLSFVPFNVWLHRERKTQQGLTYA
jgi:BASS family bile acid:Na+ symporter